MQCLSLCSVMCSLNINTHILLHVSSELMPNELSDNLWHFALAGPGLRMIVSPAWAAATQATLVRN